MTPAVRKVERAVESQEGTLARRLDERLMQAKGGQIALFDPGSRHHSFRIDDSKQLAVKAASDGLG